MDTFYALIFVVIFALINWVLYRMRKRLKYEGGQNYYNLHIPSEFASQVVENPVEHKMNEVVFCTNCGIKRNGTHLFCSNCGSSFKGV